MKSSKQWSILALTLTAAVLLGIGLCTVAVDPFFHYHAPVAGLSYPLNDQRHQTDGFLRHFSYDAIISGTSMSENFKTSEFDALFGTNSIKAPLSGSYLLETAQRLDRALETHPGTRYVIRSLDIWALEEDKDKLSEYEYPAYLYDDNLLNDVYYVLNKSIFLERTLGVVQDTREGKVSTGFDEYSYWSEMYQYGAEEILKRYSRQSTRSEALPVTQGDLERTADNIRQNVLELAEKYPDTEFYYYIPPWSIFFFDEWNQTGRMDYYMALLETAAADMVTRENIRLFSFLDAYDIVCNTDNHKDLQHYGGWINSRILEHMKNGEYLLTPENYRQHFQKVKDFYGSYDYESLFS